MEAPSVGTLPDGHRVVARQRDPTGSWTTYLEGAEDRHVARRSLLSALVDLLELDVGDRPEWLFDLARELAGRDTALGRRYPCPCCDYLTLTEPPTGTHAICPVCRWEDDRSQYCDLDYMGGANTVSLREARQNYSRLGVSKPTRGPVRPPLPEEHPGPKE